MGRKRKTPEDYHAIGKLKETKWLGPEVSNNKTKTWWECSKGHEWEACYNNIQQGCGCPHCSGRVRKTIEDYKAVGKESGIEHIGLLPENTMSKTWWKCPEEHKWEANYNRIQQGDGCPYCAGNVRKMIEDYRALAKERNIKLVSLPPKNARFPAWWQCSEGHKWEACYSNIRRGSGCPYCAGNARKMIEDYAALAKERNFEFIGSLPGNVQSPARWKCSEGHEWETCYKNIWRGSGCPHCSGNARKVIEDYKTLGKENDKKWLGSEVPNNHTKTRWGCPEGHEWEASYNSIQQGRGCPLCVDMVNGAHVSQEQRMLYEMIPGGVLNYPVGRERIDIALPTEMIAIEYDCWFWHGYKLDRDKQRDEKMFAAGWKILHVKSKAKLPRQEQVNDALTQLRNGKVFAEIILDDWGNGPTFVDVKTTSKASFQYVQMDLF